MDSEFTATVNADTVASCSDEVDVVVIGFGIGSGCAAVSVAAAGARALCRGGLVPLLHLLMGTSAWAEEPRSSR